MKFTKFASAVSFAGAMALVGSSGAFAAPIFATSPLNPGAAVFIPGSPGERCRVGYGIERSSVSTVGSACDPSGFASANVEDLEIKYSLDLSDVVGLGSGTAGAQLGDAFLWDPLAESFDATVNFSLDGRSNEFGLNPLTFQYSFAELFVRSPDGALAGGREDGFTNQYTNIETSGSIESTLDAFGFRVFDFVDSQTVTLTPGSVGLLVNIQAGGSVTGGKVADFGSTGGVSLGVPISFESSVSRFSGASFVNANQAQPPATVPVPATLGLMGLGLVGLAWKRRKTV